MFQNGLNKTWTQKNTIRVECLVLMGLRGGCGVGTAGCLWIGGCSMLWHLGGFGAVVREFYNII